jgi:uncharacterized RmlC-like cupin family protein
MQCELTPNAFTTEAEAIAEIEARGWCAFAADMPADTSELHFHDFDSVIYVVSGRPRLELEDGTPVQCGAGTRVELPRDLIHREATEAYRAVFGISVALADLTQPINKPVALKV